MKIAYRNATREEIEYAVECHCRDCHTSNNFRDSRPTYADFRAEFRERGVWDESRRLIMKSLEDQRTILVIIETEDGTRVGFCWVVFADWYEQHAAEINDLYVEEPFRRRGAAMKILGHVEKTARQRGANLLISSTGVDNLISQRLHEKYGFSFRRFEYQLWL
jgi:ribosomal protein S18 acetylase RimI-like enzyme